MAINHTRSCRIRSVHRRRSLAAHVEREGRGSLATRGLGLDSYIWIIGGTLAAQVTCLAHKTRMTSSALGFVSRRIARPGRRPSHSREGARTCPGRSFIEFAAIILAVTYSCCCDKHYHRSITHTRRSKEYMTAKLKIRREIINKYILRPYY